MPSRRPIRSHPAPLPDQVRSPARSFDRCRTDDGAATLCGRSASVRASISVWLPLLFRVAAIDDLLVLRLNGCPIDHPSISLARSNTRMYSTAILGSGE